MARKPSTWWPLKLAREQGVTTPYQRAAKARAELIAARIEEARQAGAHTLETPLYRGDRITIAYNNRLVDAVVTGWDRNRVHVTLPDARIAKIDYANVLRRNA